MIFLFPFGGICDRSLEVKKVESLFAIKNPFGWPLMPKHQHSASGASNARRVYNIYIYFLDPLLLSTQALMVLPISVCFPSRWETDWTERLGGAVTLQKWTQWIRSCF